MRIGVLGGTFDPPHAGHLAFARAAIQALELDEVLWMPANRNPEKRRPDQSSAKHRLQMVRAMLRDEPKMAVSDLEITRGGPSYAVETLEELAFARPAEYWFLVGSDALKSIGHWKNPEKLLRYARLGVATRAGGLAADAVARLPKEIRDKIDAVPMTPMEISSTDLRSRIARGQPVASMLPESVIEYIRSHNLYRN